MISNLTGDIFVVAFVGYQSRVLIIARHFLSTSVALSSFFNKAIKVTCQFLITKWQCKIAVS